MNSMIQNESTLQTYTYRQPNLTYRLGDTTIAGKISGIESVKQSVYHILMTERYSNPIYDDNYGVEFEQYIGKDIVFIAATIQENIRDALLQDDRITDVVVTNVAQSEKQTGAVDVYLSVFTIYGSFDESLSILTEGINGI